jgi:hypothetical protein
MRSRCLRALAVGQLALVGPAAGASASSLVYKCAPNICEVQSDGTGIRHLTWNGTVHRPYRQPTRSLDRRRLAFTAPDGFSYVAGPDGRGRVRLRPGTVIIHPRQPYALAETELMGHEPIQCKMKLPSRGTYPCAFTYGAFPSWGPGVDLLLTRWLDYTEIRRYELTPRIFRMIRVVARPRPGTRFNGAAVLSPDGRWLAVPVQRADSPYRPSLAVYSARSGRWVRDLTRGHWDRGPTWSPDSRQIAFARGTVLDHAWERFISGSIYRVSRSGGPLRLVVRRGYEPHWGT